MHNTLSRRLARMAAGFAPAADTGVRLSPAEAKLIHEHLQACAALARELEATRARRIWNALDADHVMFSGPYRRVIL
jgi:hypothetical protein